MRVGIIGGGASGLVAAIYSAKNGHDVTVLERNNQVGKKILITGNGRCNYFNEFQDLVHYNSYNSEYLKDIITLKNKEEILSFFEQLGIVPKIKQGSYYPMSNQATSIRGSLLLESILNGVNIITDCFVETIKKEENGFIVTTSSSQFIFDKIILSTGSKAYPKTGSTGSGYSLATLFGHHIIKPLPALVQLKTAGSFLKNWSGIRTDVNVSLYEDGVLVKEETGEIQLTDYGVSGICIFNLSGKIARGLDEGKKEEIFVNFLPWLQSTNYSDVLTWLESRNLALKNRTIEKMLEGILNYKLIQVILKEVHISLNMYFTELNDNQKQALVKYLISFPLTVISTNSFEQSQVCSGGIPLSEINISTMESKKVEGLYMTGELLDVDGDCGGYNLTFAWISGMLAGKGIK